MPEPLHPNFEAFVEPSRRRRGNSSGPRRAAAAATTSSTRTEGRFNWSSLPQYLTILTAVGLALLLAYHLAASTTFFTDLKSKSFSISIPNAFSTSNILSTPPIQTTQNTSSVPSTPELKMSTEQTFIAIKPDGVQRGLVGPIISRFENRGFKLVAIKLMSPSKDHLEKHYADLKEKPFFPGLINYMLSGPICAMVWEGRDAVKTGRTILGATNPLASSPGTIRGDFAIDVGRNVCHGSDSVENAQKEIALWFQDSDLVSWKSAQFDWIYEKA